MGFGEGGKEVAETFLFTPRVSTTTSDWRRNSESMSFGGEIYKADFFYCKHSHSD